MDGTLTQYDSTYSSEMDGKDARKMSNFSENWGMLRGSTVYVIERRHTMNSADSIFFKMWNMRIITYQIEFVTVNLESNGRTAMLWDNYLNTKTPILLNDTTRVPFSVTADAKSKATDRFTLLFALPEIKKIPELEIVRTKVLTQYNSATLQWETEGYSENALFEIERSSDANYFAKVGEVRADSSIHQYQWKDNLPIQGMKSYYRVKTKAQKAKDIPAEMVSIYIDKVIQGMNVFPNPVKQGNLKLNLTDLPKGKYEVKLLNSFGLTVFSASIHYNGGKQMETLNVNKQLFKGIYHLEVKSPDGRQKVIPVLF
jgi:hypothetical protein